MPQGLSLSDCKAALFDVDGTLVDSLRVFVLGLGDAYEHFLGIRPSETELRSLCGIPLHKQLQMFQDTPPTSSRLEQMVDYAISRYDFHHQLESTFPEAIETLITCHRAGLKTALVTSKNQTELKLFLQRFEASDRLHATVCASDVHQPKPHPESAILACQRLNVDPSQALFIGDSIYDIRCAKDAGIQSVAVGYGATDRATLLAEAPELYFDRPEELLEWARASLTQTSWQERN